MKYEVEITAKMVRTIEVEASSLDEAVKLVEKQYDDGDIVVYDNDIKEVDFHALQKGNELLMNGIDFNGLETALKEFDENGIRAEGGKWSVVRSAYDKQFEIHYEGYTVLDCIGNVLSGGYRPNNQWNEQTEQKLKEIVANAYGLELHKTISSIDELKEEIESLDWSISDCNFGNGEIGWDIAQYSPAGEDFSFSICHNNDIEKAIREIDNYAYDCFDIDEHISMWIEARNVDNNRMGVPSPRELVEDANDIQEMLYNLANYCNNLDIELNKETKNEPDITDEM